MPDVIPDDPEARSVYRAGYSAGWDAAMAHVYETVRAELASGRGGNPASANSGIDGEGRQCAT